MFEKLKNIIDDYIKILKKSSEIYNCKCKGHVLIIGINALDILHKNEIERNVIFIASKENYKRFPKVCKICTFHNVSKIFAEKFTPNNKTETLNFEKCLNENECKKYYKMIRIQQAIYYFNLLTNVKIDSSFSLKLFKQINVNSCSCMKDKNILTVNNFKNIYPCKDMSVIYGNFYEQ